MKTSAFVKPLAVCTLAAACLTFFAGQVMASATGQEHIRHALMAAFDKHLYF